MSVTPQTHRVTETESGERLDVILASVAATTRAQIQGLIKRGLVMINDKTPKKAGDMLKTGDVITWRNEPKAVAVAEVAVEVVVPDPVVVAETNKYLVLEKPAGLVVHPPVESTNKLEITNSATLSGWLLRTYPKLWRVGEYPNRPGMVHRLDKDTSGLMVVAKTQAAFENLKQQFKDRSVEKHYWALVHGVPAREHELLDFPIDRGHDGRMVARPVIKEVNLRNVSALQPGRSALTEFVIAKQWVNHTLLNVRLHTGRTHQIRVHMFAYGHPVVGDVLYYQKQYQNATKKFPCPRLFLHAYELSFTEPGTKQRVTFTSELPADLTAYLTTLP